MSQRLLTLSVVPFLLALVAAPLHADDEIDFDTQILPILQDRCFECHGQERQRGEFRIDSLQAALRGGEEGLPGITPGNVEDSNVYTRITLPEDDIDIMPPRGDVLTEEQTELIRRWIEQGADYGAGGPVIVPEADPEALAALHDLGALAMPLARDTNLIMVDFRAEAANIGDSQMERLQPVAEQLAWLNLSRTRISDEGLREFSNFENLVRLHLDNTDITDDGLEHLKDLNRLEYLNLYNAPKITDAGLEHLEGLENLRRLYLWQTQVTDDGAARLLAALPELEIDRGWENRPPVKVVEVEEVADESPTPVNDVCPVSGQPINADFTLAHNDQLVAFCCGDCRANFEENPDEFEVTLAEAPAGPINESCPVSGENISANQVVTLEGGQILAFCCGNCKANYEENPDQFADKVAELLEASN